MRAIPALAAWVLAAVFLLAGVDKAFHYEGFLTALAGYFFIPTFAVRWLAPAIILAEIWVGLGLLWGHWRRTAAIFGAGLLAVFTLALGANQLAAPTTTCGCWFTLTLAESTGAHILQNLVFLGLALTVCWQGSEERRKHTGGQATSSAEGLSP